MVLESLGIVGMAMSVQFSLQFGIAERYYSLQVYVLQTFFTKTGRRYKV
jgi:hypothetical protein